jgi:hypothetical protein
MPREMITGQDGTCNAHVGWFPDRDMQVGVETLDGRAIVDVLYGSDEALERIGRGAVNANLARMPEFGARPGVPESVLWAELGRGLLDVITGNPNDPGVSYTGLWVTLDRYGCNRLIRALRKARDSAFGRDE